MALRLATAQKSYVLWKLIIERVVIETKRGKTEGRGGTKKIQFTICETNSSFKKAFMSRSYAIEKSGM